MGTSPDEQRVRERPPSFERLYRQHRAEIFRRVLREVGNREDAEDLTQTAFLNAYRALERGAAPDRPRAWLHAIAENARRRRLLREGARPRQVPLEEEAVEATADAEDAVSIEELRAALRDLPVNQRRALLLREIQGLAYGEIAGELSLSVPSVQMLLFRARRGLRRALAALPAPGWLASLLEGGSWPGGAGLAARAAVAVGALVIGTSVVADSSQPPPHRAARQAVASPPVDRPHARPIGVAPAAQPHASAPVVGPLTARPPKRARRLAAKPTAPAGERPAAPSPAPPPSVQPPSPPPALGALAAAAPPRPALPATPPPPLPAPPPPVPAASLPPLAPVPPTAPVEVPVPAQPALP